MAYLTNRGVVDSNNSSTSALNSSATFTGTSTEVRQYPSVIVSVLTDQDGTLYIEFSPDGTNWDSSLSFSVAASTNETHRLSVTRRYFRARFTNTSASNQTYFRLQSLLGSQTQLNNPLNGVIQSDADCIATRPVDFNLAVSDGRFQGRQFTIKDGINSDIDTGSVPEDICDQGGVYSGFPAAAGAAEIVVSGADTGTVYYSYMATDTDLDYTLGSKAVTGAGTYSLGHNIWRCNFAYFDNGSTVNASDITIRLVAAPTTIFTIIQAAYGQSYTAAYTVPYNSAIYIDRFQGNLRGSTSGDMDGFFYYKEYGKSPRLRFPFELQFGTLYFDDVDYAIRIPSRTDICPRIISSSANNLSCKFSYRIIKVK